MRERLFEGQLYKELQSSAEATEWAEKHFADVLHMSFDDPLCHSIRSYTGSCSDAWNAFLRRSNSKKGFYTKKERDFWGEELDEIDAIIDFLHQHIIPENLLVFRYTNLKDIQTLCGKKTLRPKMRFSDKAYFSTTLVRLLLRSFICKKRYNCVLKLFLPQGLHGAYVSVKDEKSVLNEQEILLPPNTKFEILKIHWLRFPILIECKAIIK
ncbi:MAG: hypothetical protein J6D09_07980 [Clostridia bacterium]|nr:hypothetical protein [Clostridia bacterium]